MANESLGLLGYDSFHFAVRDGHRSHGFYTDKLDFRNIARASEALVNRSGQRSSVYAAGDAKVVVSEAVNAASKAARYLNRHPSGVMSLAFRVRDAEHTMRVLEARGGTVLAEMVEDHAEGGTYKAFEIATPLGDVNYRFIQRDNYPLFAPGFDNLPVDSSPNRFGIAVIDHITSNMRSLAPFVLWLEHVMGFQKYWEVRFHTDDVRQGVGSGLKSLVMWDPESGIKFANNEPLRPRYDASQIAKFVDDNAGPGVQHAALLLTDLPTTVADLRKNKVEFLKTPGSYYDALPARMLDRKVSNLTENIDMLRELEILVDGRDDKYLLQIFLKEAALLYGQPNAGPFFFELIARKGYPGFGEGNFRALFEAIEREQVGAAM